MIGTKLSHYTIEAELGRGGMGIVYKARDTKLDRDVALKVLPAAALASRDDRARFYREAKAAAALNHPNIAAIHQIDEAVALDADGNQVEASDGPRPFIAMEFIEGGTLEDKIKAAPLKLSEAVRIATQVAEALKAAHAKDVVHRDIKSSNIMLTTEGEAKVLDFGLAQTSASTKLTRMGSTLGTVAYMSPEQARGEEVDGRTDLWALGIVLYEMIAGANPFGGDYEQAVVYSILNLEPEPLTARRTGVPMELERIVGKALAKSAEYRYQTASGFIADLKALVLNSKAHSKLKPSPIAASTGNGTNKWPSISPVALVSAFVGGGLIVALAFLWLFPARTVETPAYRFNVLLPTMDNISDLDISEDGSTVAYHGPGPAEDNLYILDLATGQSRKLEGSEGALVMDLSDDGSTILVTWSLGFTVSSTRIGSFNTITPTNEGNPRASWGPGNNVVYEDEFRVWVLDLDSGERHRMSFAATTDSTLVVDLDWPSVLPDGKTVMATIEYAGERRGLGFWDLETGKELRILEQGGYRPQYVDSGYIFMVLGSSTEPGNLVALPFDVSKLEATGPMIPVESNIIAERMAISRTGTLVFSRGVPYNSFVEAGLYLVAANGVREQVAVDPLIYHTLKVNEKGDRAVASVIDAGASARVSDALETLIIDLSSGAVLSLSGPSTGGAADWWAGSDSVVYVDNSKRQQGDFGVMVRAANGAGQARELFRSKTGIHELAMSPNGKLLAYTKGFAATGSAEVEVRDLSTGKTVVLSNAYQAVRRRPYFSPTSDRVAFEEGNQVFVKSADGSGVAILNSTGSARPVWDRVSGRMSTYGPITQTIWSGVNKPGTISVSVAGSVTAMDVLPGGDIMLVAISNNRDVKDDSVRAISVYLNALKGLK